MRERLLQSAVSMNKRHKRKKIWMRIISVMTVIVVFCTTYALILPAITMEDDPICGAEAHTHTDKCYTSEPVYGLQCGLDPDTVVVHTHDDQCRNAQGKLICTLTERIAHTHGEECVAYSQNKICPVEHDHDESCMEEHTTLICTEVMEQPAEETESTVETEPIGETESTEETEPAEETEPTEETEPAEETQPTEPAQPSHVHGEGCYETEQVYSCGESHSHEDSCYERLPTLICDIPETILHVHTDSCYDAERTEICKLLPTVEHQHTADCLEEVGRTEPVLTCGQEEHVHVDACYPLPETEPVPEGYLCGKAAHAHGEDCRDENGKLTCSIPEHSHEATCLVADVDPKADTETQFQWKKTFKTVAFTGNWPKDTLAIAKTQLGYRESRKNVVLNPDGTLSGYTRYGDWNGTPYEGWNTLFAAFCLHYAGAEVPDLTVDSWKDAELYREGTDGIEPGDVVFLKNGRVGVASQITESRLTVIEGDVSAEVRAVTYDIADISGYGAVPAGDTVTLTYQGADYSVTVTFGKEAKIPETAVLAVREILPTTAEYETYLNQSVDSMTTDDKGKPGISFARFFDISFVVDGIITEPEDTVDVRVTYRDPLDLELDENPVAVHFAKDGIELLEAEVTQSEEGDSPDTFAFSQDSFSVVGNVVSTYALVSGTTTAQQIPHANIDGTGSTVYVLYTVISGRYYAIDGNGYPVAVTVSGSTVTMSNATDNLLWSFSGSNNSYIINNVGTNRHIHAYNNGGTNTGSTTGGAYNSTVFSTRNNTFRLQGAGGNYVYFPSTTGVSKATTSASSAANFYIAEVAKNIHVWFDGTNGGLMGLYGADNKGQTLTANSGGTATVTLPETWKSTPKYPYTLAGWYDINSYTYYPVNPDDGKDVTVELSASTVFYADWVAATYDVGQNNEHVVDSLDTDSFITTHVFDYNSLFNVQSVTHTGSVTATGHTETWSMVTSGKVPYHNENTLNFVFVDYDSNGDFSYASGRDKQNVNQGGAITAGILQNVANVSGGKDLLDLLFNPQTNVIGKNYVGTGNFLYQYMDSNTPNYDGEHDGYYYLDARKNAASFNQSDERFYLYDYLERTSDSQKDGGIGQYSDILPFNSPYLFEADMLDSYVDQVLTPGYEYDAKDGASSFQAYNSTDDATTNYWFGIRSDIEFYLPNDSGSQDNYGNYGNISTHGKHMRFEFHGDDDVWVCVDGKLMLDVGGLHGVMFGEIDFSTGTVTFGQDGGELTTVSFTDILGEQVAEGIHTLSVYYMERGSSQSNCAIYFNIAPRYTLEITKEDIYTKELLDGTVFGIFTDEACTVPALLWNDRAEYEADMDDGEIDDTVHLFEVKDGIATCWGISAGKTYYIKETKPPDGYPANNDIIRITLNNHGTASIESTTIHGDDGATEGFAVIEQNVNDTLKIVSLKLTNQKDDENTQIRVKKVWDAHAVDIPNSITVYLTLDGKRVGREAVLSDSNGWTYTWTGLPKYTLGKDGELIENQYRVGELQAPGFESETQYITGLTDHVEWVRTDKMEDGAIYTLLNSGQALAYNTTDGFYWMSTEEAQSNDTGGDAQWRITTNGLGFRLKNLSGYILTYDPGTTDDNDRFYGTTTPSNTLNQEIHFIESKLVAYDHDGYYQFDVGGDAVDSDGLVFTLNRRDVVQGTVAEVKNTLVDNKNQTFVDVRKEWDDDLDHSGDSVTMRLYANGMDTGRYLVLSAANNWQGSFDGLAYYAMDGVTPIRYTVVEDEPEDYDAIYESTTAPGRDIVTWVKVEEMTDTSGIYRIIFATHALGIDTSGNLQTVDKNPDDTSQWWQPVRYSNRTILKAYNSNRYLYVSGSTISTTTSQRSASAVTLTGEVLRVGTRYLQMTGTGIAVSEYEYNATLFTVAKRTQAVGKEGTDVTVTNTAEVGYELPQTGSAGIYPYTAGGLLLMIAALILLYNRNKRGKEERSFS